jgi:hypothetical protein
LACTPRAAQAGKLHLVSMIPLRAAYRSATVLDVDGDAMVR